MSLLKLWLTTTPIKGKILVELIILSQYIIEENVNVNTNYAIHASHDVSFSNLFRQQYDFFQIPHLEAQQPSGPLCTYNSSVWSQLRSKSPLGSLVWPSRSDTIGLSNCAMLQGVLPLLSPNFAKTWTTVIVFFYIWKSLSNNSGKYLNPQLSKTH